MSPDRREGRRGGGRGEPPLCDLCGARMRYTAQCKIVCPRCGYTRDCSDPAAATW